MTREYDFNPWIGDCYCDFEFGIEFNDGRAAAVYFESSWGRVTIIDDFDGGKDFNCYLVSLVACLGLSLFNTYYCCEATRTYSDLTDFNCLLY